MICNETGSVIEFNDERLDELLREICRSYGFDMESRELQIFGRLKK